MCRPTAMTIIAKMPNEWLQFCLSQHVKQNQHTNIRVHLGFIHGLNEFAKAFLVTVHLPVSTDKEFPGHFCGFEGVCWELKIATSAQGWESGYNSASWSIYKMARFDSSSLTAPLANIGTPVNASPPRKEEEDKCHAAFTYCLWRKKNLLLCPH